MKQPNDAKDETGDDAEEHERDATIEGLSSGEEMEAKERAGPRPQVVYASISARGLEELRRPAISLLGSGVAAGLILMMSVIGEGLIMAELPDAPGMHLIGDIGYTFGFLIVIQARLQLFTENTVTPVLPLLANPSRRSLVRTARLWAIVFAANMIGTMLAAVLLAWGDIVSDAQLAAILDVSRKVTEYTAFETLRYGVIAGCLIAALVWCLPTARGNEFFFTFIVTYLIALGDFTHVVAGSGEAFLLMLNGEMGPGQAVWGVILPALVGNVLGGTVLFATLAYVQVMEEISHSKKPAPPPQLEPPRLRTRT